MSLIFLLGRPPQVVKLGYDPATAKVALAMAKNGHRNYEECWRCRPQMWAEFLAANWMLANDVCLDCVVFLFGANRREFFYRRRLEVMSWSNPNEEISVSPALEGWIPPDTHPWRMNDKLVRWHSPSPRSNKGIRKSHFQGNGLIHVNIYWSLDFHTNPKQRMLRTTFKW